MPSVILGVPILRGQLEPEFFHSLLAARKHLYKHKIPHNVSTTECSVISASRNEITMRLLNQTNADFLMWIDSDIQFPEYGITRLVERDLPVVGGVYYHKTAKADPTVYKYNDDGLYTPMFDFPTSGLFECDGIGTGFLCIRRDVLEKFTPEVCAEIGTPFGLGKGPTGREEGEDLSFCRRVRSLGYKVMADPTVPLYHIGKIAYGRENFVGWRNFMEWREKHMTYTFPEPEIEGWMSPDELNWLYETAKGMDSIVEVGSWKGRSTHALLSGCKGTVTAIDTWKGSQGEDGNPHIEATEHDIFNDCFMKNVGHFPNLVPIQAESLEAVKKFADKSVDMVFIDGNHTYESVKADIEAWMPKARKMICGHDFQWHSVQEAVTEKFGETGTAETIWVKSLET
jgi:hypothetical protein